MKMLSKVSLLAVIIGLSIGVANAATYTVNIGGETAFVDPVGKAIDGKVLNEGDRIADGSVTYIVLNKDGDVARRIGGNQCPQPEWSTSSSLSQYIICPVADVQKVSDKLTAAQKQKLGFCSMGDCPGESKKTN